MLGGDLDLGGGLRRDGGRGRAEHDLGDLLPGPEQPHAFDDDLGAVLPARRRHLGNVTELRVGEPLVEGDGAPRVGDNDDAPGPGLAVVGHDCHDALGQLAHQLCGRAGERHGHDLGATGAEAGARDGDHRPELPRVRRDL